MVNGVSFLMPYLSDFASATLSLSSVNGPVTTYIGSCHFSKSVCVSCSDLEDDPQEMNYSLLDRNGESVGKLRCLVYLQARFDTKSKKKPKRRKRRTGSPAIKEAPQRTEIPQGFRFRKLDRGVNWDRIRNLNMERVLKNNDTAMLMSCIDDIALGCLEDEDVDPRLYHAMQLAQYSTQYLLGCRTLLNQRETVIEQATKCFEKEEADLDMQISKMRARNSALMREDDDLRDLQQQYTTLMEDYSPGFEKEQQAEHVWRRKQRSFQMESQSRKPVLDEYANGNVVDTYSCGNSEVGSGSRSSSNRFGKEGVERNSSISYATPENTWAHSRSNLTPLESRESQNKPRQGEDDTVVDNPSSQKPPILRRVVSKELVVGKIPQSVSVLPSEDDTATNIPSSWNKPKTVLHFGTTLDSNIDKTIGTNMSVDSLMGSKNFSPGLSTRKLAGVSGNFVESTTGDSPNQGIRSRDYTGVSWGDHNNKTVDTAMGGYKSSGYAKDDDVVESPLKQLVSSEKMQDSEVSTGDEGTTSDISRGKLDVALTLDAVEQDATPGSGDEREPRESVKDNEFITKTLSRPHSIEGLDSTSRTESVNSLTAINPTTSFGSMTSMKRKDISVDVINEHDDLFEHSDSMVEASLLSPTQDLTTHKQSLIENVTHIDEGGNEKIHETDDIHEFSFISDLGEVSHLEMKTTAESHEDKVVTVKSDVGTEKLVANSQQKKIMEDDMIILDTSEMSFTLPRDDSLKTNHEVVLSVDSKKPDLSVSTDTFLPDDDEADSVAQSPKVVSKPLSRLLPETASENSPSITINVHRNDYDEDHDDVLLGTNHFTATYTSRDTESSYNDTDEFQTIGGESSPTKSNNSTVKVHKAETEEEGKEQVDETDDFDVDDELIGADIDRLPSLTESQASNENSSVADENETSAGSKSTVSNPIHWMSGRAPIDLVETANALDVFVSAIRFDSSDYAKIPKVYIQFEFLDVFSEVSTPVTTNLRMSVLPVSFAACKYRVYIQFDVAQESGH